MPARLTCCGLQPPLSETLRTPLLGPKAADVNVTLTVQLAVPPRSVAHVLFEIEKSLSFFPAMEMPEIVIGFWAYRVAVSGALVMPIDSFPKFSLVGKSVELLLQPKRLTTSGFKKPPLEVFIVAAPLMIPRE